jgi:ribosomal protein S12 methylthiotransferase
MMQTASTIAFVTLGCAKNEVDTNHMRAAIAAAGFCEVPDPAAADFVIVNTCGFITAATEESLQAIFEAAALENITNGAAKLVVSGCLPSRYGDALTQQLPEVAAFVNATEEDGIVQVLAGLGAVGGCDAGDRGACGAGTGMGAADSVGGGTVVDVGDKPWAYVKISDGCSRNCSYCTIPAIRGAYRSFSFEQINREVAALVDAGIREIILIGQDTGIWRGTGNPRNLSELLNKLANNYPTTWFRVMYLQPQGVTATLLDVMAAHPNICNYLDIPLQHANARVISDMNRKGSGQDYLALLDKIRKKLPNVVLRTTLIAGFPGVTRGDACELERFIEAAQFDFAGVFTYSQEDGTVAGARSDQVPPRTRRARAQRLRDAADTIGFNRAQALVGSVQQVLVCGFDEDVDGASVAYDGQGGQGNQSGQDACGAPDIGANEAALFGRTQGQAPEVDGVVYLSGFDGDPPTPGTVVTARIVEAVCYDLFAEIV